MANRPVTPDILWWLRYNLYKNRDDLQLLDEQEAIEETLRFKDAGGSSIVELSNTGLGRNPAALVRVSKATGLNVVMGSGHYTAPSHGPYMDARTEEEMTGEIVRDITEGIGYTGIRVGIIGEIGASCPLAKNELKSLRAAARAQKIIGAPLTIHPGPHEESCIEIAKVLNSAGADLSRTVLDHMDRTVREPQNRSQLAKMGCYLEYDMFGREGYYPLQVRVVDMPNDAQRINEIMRLID
jgi:phosphotriesterase-related protein